MTFDVTFKRTIFNRAKRLFIDGSQITYDDKTMSLGSVESIRYGVLQMYVNGIPTSRVFEIELKDGGNHRINIRIAGGGFKGLYKEKEAIYLNAVNALWPVIKRLANHYLSGMERNQPWIFGPLELGKKGITIHYRHWFRKKSAFVPWNECGKGIAQGYLTVSSTKDKHIRAKIRIMRTPNAVVLMALLHYLWQSNRTVDLSNGKKMDPLI